MADIGGGVEVAWESRAVAPIAPFLHYEYRLQLSTNLIDWEDLGGVEPGGIMDFERVGHVRSISGEGSQGFVRLRGRLNMPGANLAGVDLSGADLRGANLAGADLRGTKLEGAWLQGAVLRGAQLAGALLAEANVEDVDLDGVDPSGVDWSQTAGTARLMQVFGNPMEAANTRLPHLPYHPDPADLVVNDPEVPGLAVSKRNAMVTLNPAATVGQLNAWLQQHGASVIACSPKDAWVENAVLMVQFPTATPLELYQLTEVIQRDPMLVAAAPDIALGWNVITDDSNGASWGSQVWRWDPPETPSGGNWGLEFGRVPQMWNVIEAVEKQGGGLVKTGVLDLNLGGHEDLIFAAVLGHPPYPIPMEHGNHVAGIVGARYDNGKGIDGVNPFAELVGYNYRLQPLPGRTLGSAEIEAAIAYSVFEDTRNFLKTAPGIRILNLSLGYNWMLNRGLTNGMTGDLWGRANMIATAYGAQFAVLARQASSVLFVAAAGNDQQLIPARMNSPMCTAALDFGVPNILVVEAHGFDGSRSPLSNAGGHVAAPGELILSAALPPDSYTNLSGTSMAAPCAAGVAGFLLAVDSSLKPTELMSLLQGAPGPNVDAFYSLMSIDRLPGRDKKVLRMLLDIDDGSPDGNLRVEVPGPRESRDRNFQWIQGGDFLYTDLDEDGALGDGVVDMSDFRRWRDWLIAGESFLHKLNGSESHPKSDADGDGQVDPISETFKFPRGDFNGDGSMDRDTRVAVPGALRENLLTDLGVIENSGLWLDEYYPAPTLANLVDSVDFVVSAQNFFSKNREVPHGRVAVYDAATRSPIESGQPFFFTPRDSEHIFTVPTGKTYYVASEPIPVGGGTNVMMRSPGDHSVSANDRGGDYVVDLTCVELTATAKVAEFGKSAIVSEPNEEEADVYLEALNGQEVNFGQPYAGIEAYANDQGTTYTMAISGVVPGVPESFQGKGTFTAGVSWRRPFTKVAGGGEMTFEIKPWALRLTGAGLTGEDLRALAEIRIEKRVAGAATGWQPVYQAKAEIAGSSIKNAGKPQFDLVVEEGDMPPQRLKPIRIVIHDPEGVPTWYDVGTEYLQEGHKGKILLHDVADGGSFEIRYLLTARSVGFGADSYAEASIGDPLDYGSGLRMEYGAFGELPRITGLVQTNAGSARIQYYSHEGFYYFLKRLGVNGGPPEIVALKIGGNGLDYLVDPTPLASTTAENYELDNRPLDQPLDLDHDGIDDAYELQHPHFLDPLNPGDAALDKDGDGFTNLAEYQKGMDPTVPDGPPGDHSGALYPAKLVDLGHQLGAWLHLADLDQNGRLDVISLSPNGDASIQSLLVNPDGSYQAPVFSSVGGGFLPNLLQVVASFNGDALPDAVALDPFEARVIVLRGLGNGRFETLTDYPTGIQPTALEIGDANGDGSLDILVVNQSSRDLSLLTGDGRGAFAVSPPISLAPNTPADVAVGRINSDAIPDLVVALEQQVAVLPGLSTGGFGVPIRFAAGRFPSHLVLADVDADGHLDVVSANSSSDDVSVLRNLGDGNLAAAKAYPVGDNPRGARATDLNGDGRIDLVVSHATSDYHVILLNNGDGTFGPNNPAYTASTSEECLLLDFDSNQRSDLINGVDGRFLLVCPGRPDGTFETRSQIQWPGISPVDLEIADLDGDSRPDLLIANAQARQNDTVELRFAEAGGGFRTNRSLPVVDGIQALIAGRFDAGAAMDIAVITQTPEFSARTETNALHLFFGNGQGAFTNAPPIPLADRPTDLVAGDFNRDGWGDLLVVMGLAGRLQPFTSDGRGGMTPLAQIDFGQPVFHVVLADFNQDGRTDLAAAPSSASAIQVCYATASGVFDKAQPLPLAAGAALNGLEAVDLDGDSRPDLLALLSVSFGQGTLALFRAQAGGGFGASETLLPRVEAMAQAADLDADGDLDLLVGNAIYRKQTQGDYAEPEFYHVAGDLPIRIADLNGDGKPDLVSGNSQLRSINILYHR